MATRLVIFDKDGTLVQGEIWDDITGSMIEEFVPPHRHQEAADSVGYDLVSRTVRPDAPIMSESNGATIDRLYHFVDDSIIHADDREAFGIVVDERCAMWIVDGVVEMEDATLVLDVLIEQQVDLAVCTNDSENSARAQLGRLGWHDQLPFVIGYDSGHGEKPGPGMLRAACEAFGVDPTDALMVGDSFADIDAATAAGIRSVYIGDNPTHIAAATHHITKLIHLSSVVFP